MAHASNSHATNQILGSLPREDYERLAPHLENVDLGHAKLIYDIGDPVVDVFFPLTAMVSLVTEMADGKIIEVGLVGNEGMTGVEALLGEPTSPERAIVQIPDGGVKAKFSIIRDEFARGGALHKLLLAYARKLMRQVSQTAACNASHTAEERLSRWLLMCQDRVESNKLNLTQEFLAEMLGTRRATVSISAMVLQTEGLIRYSRGHIEIIDRPALEGFTCECYQLTRDFR